MQEQITKDKIANTIDQHMKYSQSYLWTPRFNAEGRRSQEAYTHIIHPSYSGIYEGHEVQVYISYSQTCKHVYYRMSVHVDGKKGTVRNLKKLILPTPLLKEETVR